MSNTTIDILSGVMLAGYSTQDSVNTAIKILDKDPQTYWQCDAPINAYLTMQLSVASAVTYLEIYVGDTANYASAWSLSGSNNGSTFTAITSGACTAAEGWQEFTFTNTTAYLFYKWTCITPSGSILCVHELSLGVNKRYSKPAGKYLAIEFSEPLIGDVTGKASSPIWGYIPGPTKIAIASVTASSQSSTTYAAAKMIDNSTTTYWSTQLNKALGSYFILQFSGAVVLGGIRLYQGSTYQPRAFKIYGSKDAGANWTLISEVANADTTAGWKEITFSNGTGYGQYKFEVTAVQHTYYVYVYEVEAYLAVAVGNERAFSVEGTQYNWSPDGELVSTQFTVSNIRPHPINPNAISIEVLNASVFRDVIGDLTVSYDKTLGSLLGYGGPVESFSLLCSPADLVWKGAQNPAEHIEIISMAATPFLGLVTRYVQNPDENIEVASVSVTAALKHVNDI